MVERQNYVQNWPPLIAQNLVHQTEHVITHTFHFPTLLCINFPCGVWCFMNNTWVFFHTKSVLFTPKQEHQLTTSVPGCLFKMQCEKWRTNRTVLELHLRTELFLKHAPFKSHQTDDRERKEKAVCFDLCCYVARQLHMFLHHLTVNA